VMPRVIGLRRKRHVVLAKLVRSQIAIDFRRLMPKCELALAGQQVGTGYAAVVLNTLGEGHGTDGLHHSTGRNSGTFCGKG